METDQASRTAEYMALFRAIESGESAAHRLFIDPFAREFLRPKVRFAATLARIPLIREIIQFVIDTRWPGARTSGVARTRLIDDILREALHNSVKQVVILGAGFDCRAYRLDDLRKVRVFEVDHRNTLQEKRAIIYQLLKQEPENVKFLAIDFNCQKLEDVLVQAEFDSSVRTLFVWEGVTNYLSSEAVDMTFRSMRQLSRNCSVLFTYIDKAVLNTSAYFQGKKNITRILMNSGEKWTFGFEPAELEFYLKERGFNLCEDIDSLEYRERYLRPRKRLMRGYEFYHVALADAF